MKKLNRTDGCRICLTIALTIIVLISVTSFSCQLNPEGITFLKGAYDCPKLLDFSIEGKNELQMTFSQEVEFSQMNITPADAALQPADPSDEAEVAQQAQSTAMESASVTENENGTWQYDLTFADEFTCDTNYLLYAVVEDTNGNSLSFSSGFTGYNDNLPVIVLNEVRTEWAKPKPEYIELYVLEDGNLGGLYLEVYYSSKVNTYTFPAVAVHAGEYIVLHMRSVEEGSVDETDAIDASTAADSCPQARDFWYPSDAKTIGKTGVILLRERANGPLVDALLFAESSKSFWPRDEMKAAAQAAFTAGIWTGGAEPSDAVCSDKCTSTRTLSRQVYDTEGASSWIVVATSSATPGAQNSDKPAS